MTPLRGGLIGCGYFAHNHINGWNSVDGAEIVAVCDSVPEKAQNFAETFGATPYSDLERFFTEARLDFVDIVTQHDSHRFLVERAAAHKLPIICQKPLAPTLEDGASMVETCRKAGVPFMVHENFRWQTPMRAAKAETERIGDLFFGRIMFRTPYDVYANQPYLAEESRFIIADLGVHLLDLARFFFGEVAGLTAHTQRVNPRIKGEDAATILLKMESGATCIVEVSYTSFLEEDLFPQTLLHIEGANGSVVLGPHYALTVVQGRNATHRTVPPVKFAWSTPPGELVQDSIVPIQQHFIECLHTGREPDTSGADNLKTAALVFASYESAETGRTVAPRKAGYF